MLGRLIHLLVVVQIYDDGVDDFILWDDQKDYVCLDTLMRIMVHSIGSTVPMGSWKRLASMVLWQFAVTVIIDGILLRREVPSYRLGSSRL